MGLGAFVGMGLSVFGLIPVPVIVPIITLAATFFAAAFFEVRRTSRHRRRATTTTRFSFGYRHRRGGD